MKNLKTFEQFINEGNLNMDLNGIKLLRSYIKDQGMSKEKAFTQMVHKDKPGYDAAQVKSWLDNNYDIVVSESVNEAISERIYMSLTKIVNYLKEVKKLYPDATAMVPVGWVGHSSTEVNLDDAIKILTEHDRDHKRKKDPVQFYIWHIDVKNLRNSAEREKLIKDGIKGLRAFDKKYSRQFDNSPYITKINISMDSDSITQFGKDMSAGKYGSLD